MNDLIWIELNKKNLFHNINLLRQVVGKDVMIAPAVKANAYGHGLVEIAKLLHKTDVDCLCVNSIDEAEKLRSKNLKLPIMVIGYTQIKDLARAIELDTEIVIYSLKTAKELNRLAEKKKAKVKIHVKVDTGMSRQGIMPKELVKFAKKIQKLENLELEGLSTHFASSDEPENPEYFQGQQKQVKKLLRRLEKNNIEIPVIHTSNSGATMLEEKMHHDLVRPGISIYGLWPSSQVKKVWEKDDLILRPVLSLKTRVAQVKELPRGVGVSYGSTFVTEQKTKVAILPIGYYDGIDRGLSKQSSVLIQGTRCPILGRICMNIMIVDVSHLRKVRQEEEVVLIGEQGDQSITVDEIAKKIDTINYEVTTRLRESIEKKII